MTAAQAPSAPVSAARRGARRHVRSGKSPRGGALGPGAAHLQPFTLHRFPRLRSTSDHAKTLLERGDLVPPAIVLATHQTAGRGRGSNAWWSGRGCVTATFALPADPGTPIEQIPLAAGVALRRAVVQLTGNGDVQLKWPNDLVFDGRKLAGILCERLHDVDFVGIGLNIAPAGVPAHLRGRIAALRELTARRFVADQVVAAIARHLFELLAHPTPTSLARIRREFDQHHLLPGRKVLVHPSDGGPTLVGRCEGIDPVGRLLVRQGRHLHRFLTATVRISGNE